mmetsp:Transcript_6806/g.8598  ORF Transcript_6806/g.8598 Transcript_6806/m.8598 type:complete len:110 (-) Transcript_6806:1477-1806(-)
MLELKVLNNTVGLFHSTSRYLPSSVLLLHGSPPINHIIMELCRNHYLRIFLFTRFFLNLNQSHYHGTDPEQSSSANSSSLTCSSSITIDNFDDIERDPFFLDEELVEQW